MGFELGTFVGACENAKQERGAKTRAISELSLKLHQMNRRIKRNLTFVGGELGGDVG